MSGSGGSADDGGAAEAQPAGRRSALSRGLAGFGHFWWDFLIGDTPELFVAVLVILGVSWALAKASSTAAWITLPVLVLVALVTSVLRGRDHAPPS
jgi:hypothetical protein